MHGDKKRGASGNGICHIIIILLPDNAAETGTFSKKGSTLKGGLSVQCYTSEYSTWDAAKKISILSTFLGCHLT